MPPAVDKLAGYNAGVGGSASDAAVVTPDDNNDLAFVSRNIWVGGVGNLAVVMQSGAAVTLTAVPAGTLLPIRVARVKTTGTTATLILALF